MTDSRNYTEPIDMPDIHTDADAALLLARMLGAAASHIAGTSDVEIAEDLDTLGPVGGAGVEYTLTLDRDGVRMSFRARFMIVKTWDGGIEDETEATP